MWKNWTIKCIKHNARLHEVLQTYKILTLTYHGLIINKYNQLIIFIQVTEVYSKKLKFNTSAISNVYEKVSDLWFLTANLVWNSWTFAVLFSLHCS